jgi:hypothetical protein
MFVLNNFYGREGIIGKKSKMSFCPSSNRPKESAMEFDMVQFGASIVSGILGGGGLVVTAASLPGIVTKFGSLSFGTAVPGLY